ncbi:MAG: hypothetical protein AAF646_03335 [Pseudomonadota bacterium]
MDGQSKASGGETRAPGNTVAPRDAAGEIVVLPRFARPPLRLRATAGRRIEARIGDDHLSIALWRRVRGEFAIAVRRPEGAQVVDDAITAPSLESAWDALERFTQPGVRRRGEPEDRKDLEAFGDLVLGHALQQRFVRLVSEFADGVGPDLAVWLTDPPAKQGETSCHPT